jgi:hypothetical protein
MQIVIITCFCGRKVFADIKTPMNTMKCFECGRFIN